jgi:hypothetical protein
LAYDASMSQRRKCAAPILIVSPSMTVWAVNGIAWIGRAS